MVAALVAEPNLAVKENGPMEEIVLAEDGRSRELWWWKKKSKCTWEEEKNLATIDVVVLTHIIFVPLFLSAWYGQQRRILHPRSLVRPRRSLPDPARTRRRRSILPAHTITRRRRTTTRRSNRE
jgi:hypothetical protein